MINLGRKTTVPMGYLDTQSLKSEFDAKMVEKVSQADGSFLSNMGRGLKQPLLTFITDDGKTQDYTLFKNIFATHGVPCSTAIVTSRVGQAGYCTKEQLLELQNVNGWEIVSHTNNHANLTTLSDTDLDAELKNSRQWLIDNGFKGHDFLMIPYGLFDDRVKRHISKYYKGCRNSNAGINEMPFSSYNLLLRWLNTDTTVDALTGFPKNSLNHFKALIDYATMNNLWLIIGTHSWEIEQWNYSSLLNDIVLYASQKTEIKKVGFKDAFELCGNIVDQTNYLTEYDEQFVIGGNGVVKSNIARTKFLAPNSLTFNTQPMDTPKGYLSVCNISGTNKVGFPNESAGVLLTYNFTPNYNEPTNVPYVWQEFHEYNTNKFYRRRGSTTLGWVAFEQVGGGTESSTIYELAAFGTYNGNHLLQDFPVNKVTSCAVNNATAALGGLPTTIGGELKTHRISNDAGYCYQTYRKWKTNEMWTRYADTLTTWSAWQKITVV